MEFWDIVNLFLHEQFCVVALISYYHTRYILISLFLTNKWLENFNKKVFCSRKRLQVGKKKLLIHCYSSIFFFISFVGLLVNSVVVFNVIVDFVVCWWIGYAQQNCNNFLSLPKNLVSFRDLEVSKTVIDSWPVSYNRVFIKSNWVANLMKSNHLFLTGVFFFNGQRGEWVTTFRFLEFIFVT